LHDILSLLLLVSVGSVRIVRSAFGASVHGSHGRRCSSGLGGLQERYAQGEIQRMNIYKRRGISALRAAALVLRCKG
jgi:hypothetical protein